MILMCILNAEKAQKKMNYHCAEDRDIILKAAEWFKARKGKFKEVEWKPYVGSRNPEHGDSEDIRRVLYAEGLDEPPEKFMPIFRQRGKGRPKDTTEKTKIGDENGVEDKK